MSHSFPLPDTECLEQLISRGYKTMPGPDRSRIINIEERLLRKLRTSKPERKLNKIPWWIVLLLAGGFATAAWWAGEEWFSIPLKESGPMVIPQPAEMLPSQIPKQAENTVSEPIDETFNHRDTPIIYQRESY